VTTEAGGWTLAPGMLRELRLKRAEEALSAGDPDLATVEAEELLDEEPDHLTALLVVGDASVEIGMPACAVAAFSHVLSLTPAQPRAQTGLCIARFELGDLEGCVGAAEAASATHPDLIEPWYYRGLALERLGRRDEAAAALEKAAAMAPDLYPIVPGLDDDRWAAEVRGGLASLPEPLRGWVSAVPVETDWFPNLAALRTLDPTASPTVPAVFEGEPPPLSDSPAVWSSHPNAIRLYRGNLERISGVERVSVARLVAEAVRMEALDWLGLPIDAHPLPDRGQ